MGSLNGSAGLTLHRGGNYNENVTSAVSPAWGDANELGFRANWISFYTDGMGVAETVEISFDGTNVACRLVQGTVEANKSLSVRYLHQFYTRSATGSQSVHVEAGWE